ncbi:hypothetical protein FOZ62_004363 [Perkinsus olseni]|uniref:Uncharacterized protein n=1 Tax=Perkinsus olseni TaxID=32597 RepID=A0A7J6UGA1_PEROL|nr:hypothetical protein FOZ62_004363 [Perkinsus olseni]
MSLLRRAACPQRLVPKRVCEAVKNPLIGGPNQKARGAITSGFAGGGAKRLGGKGYGIMADWCDHGYSFTKGQAITGEMGACRRSMSHRLKRSLITSNT